MQKYNLFSTFAAKKKFIMKKTNVYFILFLLCALVSCRDDAVRILILTGQNNHNWRETTPLIQEILNRNGIFKTDVTEKPDTLNAQMLKSYDVIVSNWNSYPEQATQWNPAAIQALFDFVKRGGGFVCIHSASFAHYDCPPFFEITGGRWGDSTHHGPISEFRVQITHKTHPITKGVQDFTIKDELWVDLECSPSAKVLCVAQADEYRNTPGKLEPVVLITEYGKGRGYYLALGHDVAVMAHPDWQKLLMQGTKWAAKKK